MLNFHELVIRYLNDELLVSDAGEIGDLLVVEEQVEPMKHPSVHIRV